MKPLWRKFRKSGVEQSILPEAPIATVIAFAGTAIPAGWLDMTTADPANTLYAGPYLVEDYWDLYNLIGSYTVSGTDYVAVPAIKQRTIIGAYDTAYGVTGPGATTVTTTYAETIKDPAQGDYGGTETVTLETDTSGDPYNYGADSESPVRAHTHPLGRSHSHGTVSPNAHSHTAKNSFPVVNNNGSPNVTSRRSMNGFPQFGWTIGGSTHNLSVNSATITYNFYYDYVAASQAHNNVQPYTALKYIIKA